MIGNSLFVFSLFCFFIICIFCSNYARVLRHTGPFVQKYTPSLGLVGLGLGTHLFVKVPRPEDSEVTFSVFE